MKHKQFLENLIGPLSNQGGGGGTPAVLINKNVSANGTYNASSDNADGYSQVVVNVSGGGGEATLRGLLDGSLTGVLSDNVVTSLREYVCDAMTGLTGASFPEVTNIGEFAFNNCSSLVNVSFPKLVQIPSHAFSGCTALKDAVYTLVSGIGESAFYNCKALTKVNSTFFPGLDSASAYLSSSCFSGCAHITEVDLPATVDALPSNAFNTCTGLTYVKFLGRNINGSSVFQGCNSLMTLLLPNVTTITNQSNFRACTSLESVELPALTSMTGQYNFRECTALKRVTFGAQLANVASNVFQSCSHLEAVVFTGATAVVTLSNTNAFTGTPIASGTGYIYVPDALVSSWKAASNWSTYASKIKPLSELPT